MINHKPLPHRRAETVHYKYFSLWIFSASLWATAFPLAQVTLSAELKATYRISLPFSSVFSKASANASSFMQEVEMLSFLRSLS